MLGVYSLFVALTTISVILRVYCRIFVVKKFGIDDYLAAAAWVGLKTSPRQPSLNVNTGHIHSLCNICADRSSPWHGPARTKHSAAV
jgi:hypothetical protein